ncbi:hypothetical protein [Alteromonas lipolytica]|uniref:Curli production assembly/transport component CsgG n=1 Tax=Alteromonas lipolytica TaxID=1856405 RepID=A0A1E8FBL0_9ALTE|nr:hypothetical protein [Alteromonas lipolytica]OFI33290.1 hypothetical protein BFC17_03250 [Alteromonas lipolytica]GGF60977.1 hypothetical protein GCM10011338_11530 [Alteromonas lipolytica]
MGMPLRMSLAAAIFTVSVIFGCSTTTISEKSPGVFSVVSYQVNIPMAEVQPSLTELQGKQKSLIVLPVTTGTNAGINTNLIHHFLLQLDKSLREADLKVVDSDRVTKLLDDIEDAKATDKHPGPIIDVADAAILPTLQTVSLSQTFSPAANSTVDGLPQHSSASCRFHAAVTGKVTIYDLSTFKIIATLILEGTETTTLATSNEKCPLGEDDTFNLTSQAANNAIGLVMPEVQHIFSQPGYVLDYRKKGDIHLVKISLGTKQKLKAGQKIDFARRFLKRNYLGGELIIDTVQYDFQGIVSDMIDTDIAWVEVHREAETQLMIGDQAKVHTGPDCNFGGFKMPDLLNLLKRPSEE